MYVARYRLSLEELKCSTVLRITKIRWTPVKIAKGSFGILLSIENRHRPIFFFFLSRCAGLASNSCGFQRRSSKCMDVFIQTYIPVFFWAFYGELIFSWVCADRHG